MDVPVVQERPADGATTAGAPAGAERRFESGLSVGYSVVYLSGFYNSLYGALSAAYSLWLAPGFEGSVGGRFVYGDELKGGKGLEGFAALLVAPHFGAINDENGRTVAWRPAGGVEIDASTVQSRNFGAFRVTTALTEDVQPGPLYLMFVARPARFRLTNFNATLLGLSFGTPFGDLAKGVRLQLDVLNVGYVW